MGRRARTTPGRRRPRRPLEAFDAIWPRFARAAGFALAVAEWTVAQKIGRPVDSSVIGLAAAMVALPAVLAKRGDS